MRLALALSITLLLVAGCRACTPEYSLFGSVQCNNTAGPATLAYQNQTYIHIRSCTVVGSSEHNGGSLSVRLILMYCPNTTVLAACNTTNATYVGGAFTNCTYTNKTGCIATTLPTAPIFDFVFIDFDLNNCAVSTAAGNLGTADIAIIAVGASVVGIIFSAMFFRCLQDYHRDKRTRHDSDELLMEDY